MSEIISKDDVDQLKFVLNYHKDMTYLDSVVELQEFIKEQNLETKEMPVINHFAPDVYARQMDASAGDLVISRMHRTEHLNILMKGSISILTEDGVQYFKAPMIMKSDVGSKRIGYFHEDSSWLTIHPNPNNITEEDALIEMLTVPESEAKAFIESLNIKELPQ